MARVKLGDIAREYKATCGDQKEGLRVVGLEHLIPQQIILTLWDEGKENTFTKMFKKGQVLFGRRRAYLKKAAVAPFDGICSGDITVIEAIPGKIIPELLPFIFQNDTLFDFAVERSAGSLSPRVKWEHLKNFEFELPELDKQKELADILWASERAKTAYRELISSTDELVKSQFIEMFGAYPKTRLGDYIEQVRGVSYKPNDLLLSLEDTHITLLRANNISNNEINFDEVQYVSRAKVSPQQIIREDDILMCASSGSLEHVGKAAICSPTSIDYTFGAFCKVIRTKKDLLPKFLATYFVTDEYRDKIMSLACGTNINNLKNEYIDNLLIPIPEMSIQENFVRMIEQFDKSKFAAKQALENLERTQKSLMNRYLG